MEKSNFYIREIIRCLLDGKIHSTREIAEVINLSEKATRNKLEQVEYYLKELELGSIEKKPRVGVWLETGEEQKKQLQEWIVSNQTIVVKEVKDRQDEILRILFKLLPRESVTTQKLAQELYLSNPTVLKVIKECQAFLEKYNIRIVNERSHGFYLSYHENDYRRALKDFICSKKSIEEIRNNIQLFFHNIDVNLIDKCIVETENEWNYKFTDDSFYEILIYCCLACQRKDFSIPIHIQQEDMEILERYNEYPFTVAIFQKLHDRMHIMFSNEDILFLATQIMCSKFMGIDQPKETWKMIQMYDLKLLNFVDEILKTIGKVLEKELCDDIKLKESLVFHLRSTIFRLRYGSPQNNSLVSFIKSEYKKVFRATWSVSILFEKYYGVQITEDEIGFITLYIQSALERHTQRYRAILIEDFTRGHAQLICERISRTIPEIKEIQIISRHDFKLHEHRDDADMIITSRELLEKDNRVIVISNLLSDDGMIKLRTFMDELNLSFYVHKTTFSPICYPLFDPELIFLNLDYTEKKDILFYVSKALESHGYVMPLFAQSVYEREQATSTAIGNYVALPHGMQAYVNQSRVAIITLKKPISWDKEEMVDVIFLLAFKLSTHDEIKRVQSFYQEFISLIETNEKISVIRNARNALELYKYLIQ